MFLDFSSVAGHGWEDRITNCKKTKTEIMQQIFVLKEEVASLQLSNKEVERWIKSATVEHPRTISKLGYLRRRKVAAAKARGT